MKNQPFKIPDGEVQLKAVELEEKPVLVEPQKTGFSDSEKEDLEERLERAEKEREIFEKELRFLIDNIVQNKSISGPKFTCNLPQKEIDRIKILLRGD